MAGKGLDAPSARRARSHRFLRTESDRVHDFRRWLVALTVPLAVGPTEARAGTDAGDRK
jgi:hypothetical protein